MDLFSLGEYWFFVGALALMALNLMHIMTMWGNVRDARASYPRGQDTSLRRPLVMTILFVGSVGMLFLGVGSNAPTKPIHLEGQVEAPSQKALEVELRNNQELVLQTRTELEQSRQENARLVEELHRQKFEKDVEKGNEHMEGFRRKILNREGEK